MNTNAKLIKNRVGEFTNDIYTSIQSVEKLLDFTNASRKVEICGYDRT